MIKNKKFLMKKYEKRKNISLCSGQHGETEDFQSMLYTYHIIKNKKFLMKIIIESE